MSSTRPSVASRRVRAEAGLKAPRRRLASATLVVAAALLSPIDASADQTDPRLSLFFDELRDADPTEASRLGSRILEVWATTPSPTAQLLFDRALEAEYAAETDLAEELLGHVTGLNPSFAEGWAARGRVRLVAGNRDGALADFEKALELEPRHYPVQLSVARLRLAAGDERGALRAYLEALSWNPHLDDAKAAARRLQTRVGGQGI